MTTLPKICDNASRIKESGKTGTKLNVKRIPYSRISTMERTEKMLSTWVEDQNQHHMPVSKLLVQAKACCVYQDLSKDDDNAKPFNARSGCFCNFMKRYNFNNIKMREKLLLLCLLKSLLRNCSILMRKEVMHLNMFSTLMRLLFLEKDAF